MEDYPRTILEFEERFATEEACRQYLSNLRWPDGFCCPRCGSQQAWAMKRRLYWCKSCAYQVSLTAGTIFQDTRKPLRLWFRAMWYVTNQKQGVSALGLQRFLGLGSYRTAWSWLHKLRTAMVRPGRDRLSGVVEVDETYIGGAHTGKPGRGSAGKSLVLIAVEDKGKKMGRIRLAKVKDASACSLIGAIKKGVEQGSRIRTDGWAGYLPLNKEGYHHVTVRQEATIGDNLLPKAHRVASLLKRWLLGTHQGAVESSHLDFYLDEYTFRFNRRSSRSRGKLFYRLAQQALAVPPVTGRDLKGGDQNT